MSSMMLILPLVLTTERYQSTVGFITVLSTLNTLAAFPAQAIVAKMLDIFQNSEE